MANLSFTQGFLLGQLSIVILIGAFIKFFIFGETPPSDSTASARLTSRRARTLAHKRSLSSSVHSTPQKLRHKRSNVHRSPQSRGSGSGSGGAAAASGTRTSVTTSAILAKTYYNVHSHQPESLDWFNVLIAQTIAQIRDDAQQDDAILDTLTNVLNGDAKPSYVGDIRVTEISLGDEFPIFSNCRVWPMDEDQGGDGRLQARMDVDLSDFITLGVETKLILNYPQPMAATLPVALAVSVVRFSGTLSISFVPPALTSTGPSPTTLTFSFLDDYRLDLSVRSLLGARSRLQDVPKIAQLVEARLHAWFDDRCVEPRFQEIVLPSLWPRKKNTRGGGGVGGVGDEEAVAGEVPPTDRDVMAEARLEVEAERRAARERERMEAEGMRWRGPARVDEYDTFAMPGSMPGMMAP